MGTILDLRCPAAWLNVGRSRGTLRCAATLRPALARVPSSLSAVIPWPSRAGRAVRVLESFESTAFRRRFGIARQRLPAVLDVNQYGVAADALAALGGELAQPVAAGRLPLDGSLGVEAVLEYEVTSNTYSAFALIFERPRIQSLRRMRTLWTPGTSQG
jgi:hypothetical protein